VSSEEREKKKREERERNIIMVGVFWIVIGGFVGVIALVWHWVKLNSVNKEEDRKIERSLSDIEQQSQKYSVGLEGKNELITLPRNWNSKSVQSSSYNFWDIVDPRRVEHDRKIAVARSQAVEGKNYQHPIAQSPKRTSIDSNRGRGRQRE
jgi:hypothetical protein